MITDIRFSPSLPSVKKVGKDTIKADFMETFHEEPNTAFIVNSPALNVLLYDRCLDLVVMLSIIGLVHETEHCVIDKLEGWKSCRALDNVFRTDTYVGEDKVTVVTHYVSNKSKPPHKKGRGN